MMNNLNRKSVWILALLLVGCSESPEGDQNRIVAKQPEQAAVVQRVDGGDMTTAPRTGAPPAPPPFAKVVAVDMRVDKNGAVALKNPRVQYGEPPNQTGNPPMFTAQVLDRQGVTILSVPLWDPRWTFVWSDDKNRDYVDLAESADTVVIVPFKGKMATMSVVKDKERLASVDLSPAVAAFCAKNREDPDCRESPQPTPPKLQKPQ